MSKQKPKRDLVPVAVEYDGLLSGISDLLEQARRATARSVNSIMTATYWEVGRRIVEHEQGGHARAEYGEELLKRLAKDLTARYGRGFSERNLELEERLIQHLEAFLLELGGGFTFVARQKGILIGTEWYRMDL